LEDSQRIEVLITIKYRPILAENLKAFCKHRLT